MNEKNRETGSFNCPQCGGMLHYDIEQKKLICISCESVFELDEYQPLKNKSESMEVVQYRCPQCGAQVHTTQTNMVSYCAFCGSEILFTERMALTKRPDKIVPFKFTREQCEEKYREFMGLPENQPLKFMPIYVPFYWYQEDYEGEVKAACSVVEGNWQTFYGASGFGVASVKGEMECASSQMEVDIANKLMFSDTGAQPFSEAYLCGFYAEAPDLDDNRSNSQLSMFTAKEWFGKFISELKTDGTKKCSYVKPPPLKNDKVELWLMPVWLLAESYGQRVLYTAINGADGTIVCDRPMNNKFLLKMAGLIAMVAFVLLMLLNGAIILRPNVVTGFYAMLTACACCIINGKRSGFYKQAEVMQQREKTGRCCVVNGQTEAEAINAKINGKHGAVRILSHPPSSIFSSFVLLMGVIAGCFNDGGSIIWLLMASFAFIVCRIKEIVSHTKEKEHKFGTYRCERFSDWVITFFVPAVLLIINVYLNSRSFTDTNRAVAGLVSDHAWMPVVLCIVSFLCLISNRVHVNTPRFEKFIVNLQTALVALSTLLLIWVHVREIHYAAAVALLVLLLIRIIYINRTYNDYITRPVPYFGRKDGEEA